MKVYIAGRITGDPRYREKFAEAEAALREVGHIPLNPAVLPEGMEKADYMRICTAMLDSADTISLLSDWTASPGAQLELHYADYVGKNTMDLWKVLAVRRSTAVQEHPRKTRQEEFLRQWPGARVDLRGVVQITPCAIDSLYRTADGRCAAGGVDCTTCRRKYWMQEVE